MVPITSSRAEPVQIAFTGTLKEKQVRGHPTMLKRQDLIGLLKSDLRDETQTCANWRSGLAVIATASGAVEGKNGGSSKSDRPGHH